MGRPGRVKETTTTLNSLVRAGDGFRVFDPEFVTETDKLYEWRGRFEREAPEGVWIVAVMLLAGIALSASLGVSWLSYLLWFLAGGTAGVLACALVVIPFTRDDEAAYRQKHGAADPFRGVADDPEAMEACQFAERIAATAAWRDRVIDPEHSLATVLWAAVSGRERGEDVATTLANLKELARIGEELDRSRGGAVAEAMRSAGERARDLSGEMLDHGRAVRELTGEDDPRSPR